MAKCPVIKCFKANHEAISNLPENKRELANVLLDKLSFMETELSKLQKDLKKNGWVEVYQHGANQSGNKRRSEADVYISLIKNYNATVKVLTELVPDKVDEMDATEREFFG